MAVSVLPKRDQRRVLTVRSVASTDGLRVPVTSVDRIEFD